MGDEIGLKLTGSAKFDELWSYLKDESPRGLVVSIAAHFDGELAALVGIPVNKGSLSERIKKAFAAELISEIERDDLNVIRDLRNSFAHDLKATDFDTDRTAQVDSLKIWQAMRHASRALTTPKARLIFVAGTIAARLNNRKGTTVKPDFDPKPWQGNNFLPIVGF